MLDERYIRTEGKCFWVQDIVKKKKYLKCTSSTWWIIVGRELNSCKCWFDIFTSFYNVMTISCHMIPNVESCCSSRERMSGQNFREGMRNVKDRRLRRGKVFPASCASESNAPGAWQNIGIWQKDCDHKWVWECDLLGYIINISAFCTHHLNCQLVCKWGQGHCWWL